MTLGEAGEISARSCAVMIAYNDNPGPTEVAIDAHGRLHTGDLGTLDEQGFRRLTGRVKEMTIRSGENHFPAEIEAAPVRHRDVAQVAVVGLPDEKWGAVIAAFILSDGVPEVAWFRAHCRQSLTAQNFKPSTETRPGVTKFRGADGAR